MLIPSWSTGHDTRLPNGSTQVRILCSVNAFEQRMTRNPLLPAKAVDRQPTVSRSTHVYNWLVSWHIWGVRIRTGKTLGLGKASLIGAHRDSNVSSVKNQNQRIRHEDLAFETTTSKLSSFSTFEREKYPILWNQENTCKSLGISKIWSLIAIMFF